MIRALAVAVAIAIVAALWACDGGAPSPIDLHLVRARDLPRGAIPSDDELRAEIADALDKKQLDELDRALDAADPGELIEHATLSQMSLDRGIFTLDHQLVVGDELFAYPFRPENGLGNGLAHHAGFAAGSRPAPNLRRVHGGAFGGPDAQACADCHNVGGDDGAGAASQNAFFRGDGDRTRTADVRNPPAVLGLGPIEALAREMTRELQRERDAAIAAARTSGASVTASLHAKDLAFGELVAHADGSVDGARVTGVAPDLIVRPFGWKGHQATLRAMIQEAFRLHLGVVSMAAQDAVRDRRADNVLGDGPAADADADGVTIELDDGMVSTAVAYLAQLEVPLVQPPDDPELRARFDRGEARFTQLGCATCHVPAMTLDDPVLVTRAEQPENAWSAPIAIDTAHAGRTPKIEPRAGGGYTVRLFSDLRRHDLGTALTAPSEQPADGGAIGKRMWLTRPLWGLADTAPYLHDGRALTIEDAIRAHGGEAQAARDAFVAATRDARGDVLVFLTSLARKRMVVAP